MATFIKVKTSTVYLETPHYVLHESNSTVNPYVVHRTSDFQNFHYGSYFPSYQEALDYFNSKD